MGEKSKSIGFFVFIFLPKWSGLIGGFTANVRMRPPRTQDYGPRSGQRGKVSEMMTFGIYLLYAFSENFIGKG